MKKDFRGWIPLLILIIFVLVPQLYIWKTQQMKIKDLREIYRFAFLYIILFVIPMEIHYTRKELCWFIGFIVVYGLICCGYEVWKHPKVWESMRYFSSSSAGLTSFFGQRNRFGAYTALWMIICLFAIQLSGKKVWLIPAFIFAAFMVMTESRGAIFLGGAFILFCVISYRRRLGTRNLLLILLDILIIAAILWLFPPTQKFISALIDVDRGVTGRDRIWQIAWEYYLEGNPLIGHGLGVEMEKIMVERLRSNVSTHNVYLYILNCGGICLMVFYILSFAILLQQPHHRHHYLIPLLLATCMYGFFELACAPFDNWHLSIMFTICLFFLPAATGVSHPRNYIPING